MWKWLNYLLIFLQISIFPSLAIMLSSIQEQFKDFLNQEGRPAVYILANTWLAWVFFVVALFVLIAINRVGDLKKRATYNTIALAVYSTAAFMVVVSLYPF
ncbi:hypothetical protein WH50_05545 [Pokkaliibacter plantistimulans]|uniref:Yip1 domain-containing protein n=1 Tax=Pokkaliibacter plantistimulans TaxID=1635171 RepID=A0ABX5M2K9_9GAMM|nr:hypothetical protein [Pokkaliibacter plantistimulans]PXF32195.1 hypothetical protein WH50_05545 [Pokkaliibacter plantistimulans]